MRSSDYLINGLINSNSFIHLKSSTFAVTKGRLWVKAVEAIRESPKDILCICRSEVAFWIIGKLISNNIILVRMDSKSLLSDSLIFLKPKTSRYEIAETYKFLETKVFNISEYLESKEYMMMLLSSSNHSSLPGSGRSLRISLCHWMGSGIDFDRVPLLATFFIIFIISSVLDCELYEFEITLQFNFLANPTIISAISGSGISKVRICIFPPFQSIYDSFQNLSIPNQPLPHIGNFQESTKPNTQGAKP